jgi:hypothetical protein
MGATQSYILDDSFVADSALAQYRIVVMGGSQGHAKYPAAEDAAKILGVTQHSTSASGDTVLVRRAGMAKIQVASANVQIGHALRAYNIIGMADMQTAMWASGDGVLGYAEQASAASGDIVECWLAIRQLLA